MQKNLVTKKIFDTLHHLPDLVPQDSNTYKKFTEIYGTETSEEFRPSCGNVRLPRNCGAKLSHGIPFGPTGQTAKAAGLTIQCVECLRPRCLYSKTKLLEKEARLLEQILDNMLFTCGTSLQEMLENDELITEDISANFED